MHVDVPVKQLAAEIRNLVQTEILRLPELQRGVLFLKVQEQKSYRDIAKITGMSITDVGYLLHSAVKELSKRLNHRRKEPR